MCASRVLQARILDSVVFKRDMEVGRQEGHQLQTELDLTKVKWEEKHGENKVKVDSRENVQGVINV